MNLSPGQTIAGDKPLDPFRVFFPIGAALAVAGSGLWLFGALGWIPYPGTLHASIMIQGFEQSFIMGFLLTAFPRFTRSQPCSRIELLAAVLPVIGFGAAALTDNTALTQVFFFLSMLILIGILGRRFYSRQIDPPEEVLFIGVGLLLGLVGSAFALLTAFGVPGEPTPRLGIHMISLGMVVSLVLGVGALLVPVFIGIRDPLVIPKIAKPHARRGRRILYVAMASLLALSFVAESRLQLEAAAWLRALVATTMGLLVWKLYKFPGRQNLTSFTLWISGWFVMLGLIGAALIPMHAIGALHLTFIGGFGLITLGIGTRVLVTHGGHSPEAESSILTWDVVGLVILSLVLRSIAETETGSYRYLLALSGASWSLGWLLWAVRAIPRIIHR